MLCTGSNNVDPGSVDVTMAKDISKFCNIFFDAIECTRKQMTEIMWKYFTGGSVK